MPRGWNKANAKRGVKPIEEVITRKNLFDYLEQFIDVKNKYIDGNKYIKGILKRLGIEVFK